MKNKNVRLVYSTDASENQTCSQCRQLECQCQKTVGIVPQQSLLKIRLETKGRGGKAVSVIFDLPHNPEYFSALCKKIKSHCGTGGTYKDGRIEVQGDHRNKIKVLLEKMGFPVKLAGGGSQK